MINSIQNTIHRIVNRIESKNIKYKMVLQYMNVYFPYQA